MRTVWGTDDVALRGFGCGAGLWGDGGYVGMLGVYVPTRLIVLRWPMHIIVIIASNNRKYQGLESIRIVGCATALSVRQ